ncbi:SKP1-like protein 21, partial [Glycine soja]
FLFEFERFQIILHSAIWQGLACFTYWLKYCDRGLCNTANSPVDLVHLSNVARMSETDLAVIKPEMMKPYVWLQTSDDSIQQVEQEIAMFSPLICQEIIQKGMGSSKNCAICLPQQVSPAMLSLILDYCRFHQVPGRSNKERKSYDEKFVRIDTERLCELTSAADSLQLKPLVDLTSRALARIIEGKTPEEIRDIFHLPDDLTEVSGACENSEEKLEPLRNITADPRIRLLNRLYAKKRKELKERGRLKISVVSGLLHICINFHSFMEDCIVSPFWKQRNNVGENNVEVEEEHVDERSVDDLLSFINGNDGVPLLNFLLEAKNFVADPKGVKTSKNKKKNRRKKEQQKNSSLKEASEMNKKEVNGHDIRHQSSEAERISETSYLPYAEDDTFSPKVEFDDGDIDDEIDPALKEKIDREVEDFARRLNSDWPERMQELLSSGQERKTMLFTTDGFLRRQALLVHRVLLRAGNESRLDLEWNYGNESLPEASTILRDAGKSKKSFAWTNMSPFEFPLAEHALGYVFLDLVRTSLYMALTLN